MTNIFQLTIDELFILIFVGSAIDESISTIFLIGKELLPMKSLIPILSKNSTEVSLVTTYFAK